MSKKPWETVTIPYTNTYYVSISPDIHKLPKSYDKAKRHKDENGDEYVYIDRVYGGLYEQHLTQKDGTEYKGKLYHSGRNTYTADGRWFDSGGLPIEKPKKDKDD
mgnify:CR=1 FL=1|tara:strand:- start:572 stop:886 length:315 start_codon:yes stop_codon:yes gene_type:complete